MRNISEKVAEKIKTHILCSITFLFLFFFRKSCLSLNVEQDSGTGQATDDNMANAHYMLDN
jgi:hypothetical protein